MSDTVTVELTPAKATVVATGTAGPTGVVAANPPATYDLATRTIGVALGTTAGTAAAGDALAAAVAAEAAHVASATAHSASHVTVAAGAGVTSTDVQAAVAEITGMIQSQEAGDSAAIAAVAAGLASEITRATTAEATKQAHDADLDTIAALDSTTAGALVTDGAGWIRKTYAQLKTALGLVKADVGLGNVDNTSDANKPVSTAQAAADAATLSSAQTFATSAVGTEASRATTAEAAEAVARAAADGTRLNWRGAWAATTAYVTNDLVTFNGGLYRAPSNFTSGGSFVLANWVELVAQSGTYASSLTRTAVKTADYAAVAGDLVPVDTTAGNITVTLPAAPADRSRLAVKHILQGGTNTVTVACGGADVFNRTGGATTLSLSLLAQGVLLEYTASAGVWTIVADDIALAQLDLRFARLASANEFTSSQTFDSGFTMGTPSGVSANVWLQSASQGWQGGPKWEFGIDTSNNGGGVDFYLAKAAWRVILDGVLNSTTTLTSATAAFGTSDVGKTVTGTGIPAATTIASVTDASTVVLSAAATATATGVTVTIGTVNAVGDLIYITNGKGGSPTVGIGVTPPGSSHRLQVAGSAADPALGGLRLIGVVGQTGDFLTVADSGNTTLLQVDKSGILRGSPTGLGGVGMALTVGAQVKALQMANSGITAVYGWEFNANTGTTIKFRYETGGKDLLTFDTAGNAVLGPTGLATNSTNGFVHIPYMAGAPTGTPTGFSGHMPITIDTTNSKIWVWTGAAWKGVVVA